jgi:hypothetical protein
MCPYSPKSFKGVKTSHGIPQTLYNQMYAQPCHSYTGYEHFEISLLQMPFTLILPQTNIKNAKPPIKVCVKFEW